MQKTKKHILLIPGDGIGPEVMTQAEHVTRCVAELYNFPLSFTYGLAGGVALDATGSPLDEQTLLNAHRADAILFGAVGGKKWDSLPAQDRPEKGLLQLRSELQLFANLRPALLFAQLAESSSLRPELVSGLDILIVRELTGGAYFGTPRGIHADKNGQRYGCNTISYNEDEIARIARSGFELAMQRNRKLCSVDKANVLEVSMLWREVVNEVATSYPQVELSHMYVDNAAMQLVREPKQFDVIVTDNMFGDILSDCAAMLTGSIGMLPSASLDSKHKGLYEPVHGSAPDIAGNNSANPIACILCVAMMFAYTFDRSDIARAIEQAVKSTLDAGFRTADIATDTPACSTEQMGEAILNALTQEKP